MKTEYKISLFAIILLILLIIAGFYDTYVVHAQTPTPTPQLTCNAPTLQPGHSLDPTWSACKVCYATQVTQGPFQQTATAVKRTMDAGMQGLTQTALVPTNTITPRPTFFCPPRSNLQSCNWFYGTATAQALTGTPTITPSPTRTATITPTINTFNLQPSDFIIGHACGAYSTGTITQESSSWPVLRWKLECTWSQGPGWRNHDVSVRINKPAGTYEWYEWYGPEKGCATTNQNAPCSDVLIPGTSGLYTKYGLMVFSGPYLLANTVTEAWTDGSYDVIKSRRVHNRGATVDYSVQTHRPWLYAERNVKYTSYLEIRQSLQEPTQTPTPAPVIDCSQAKVNPPAAWVSGIGEVGRSCYTIIPAIQVDIPLTSNDIDLPAFVVCMAFYSLPALHFMGMAVPATSIGVPAVAWMVRKIFTI